MNRIDRLSAILIQLQTKRIVTAQEIADRFDISLRTVYRDIRALEAGGVPIGSEAGRGYFIVEGYRLPPVMFTKEEASAIVIAGKLIEKKTDRSVERHFTDALMKIRAVLHSAEKDFVQTLEKHVEVIGPKPTGNESFPDFFLTDIKTALVENRVLAFDYYASYSDETTKREVEPLGICYYSNHWHLIAHCRLRKELRDFRTDRIMKLKVLEENFDKSRLNDYKGYSEAILRDTELQEIKVKFEEDAARYITEQRYYYGFIEEKRQENGVVMTFMTGGLNFFARWLLMFGNGAEVLEPPALKHEMYALLNELNQHYGAEFLKG